ncbi:endo-1,4-beta-xylanase [Bacillus sp. J14TS2]|uniref:glycoside hydrolase family 43 protein n=1 Tax=Bacillus sp. J14TS2 TaxID=2807188 RepID=UPI001B0DFB0F|nr:glycoside hydrolase family 43 protein [Bacillus sp. J14TS2]GIN69899.1 endo-1,4-beta-xylanase [Bacillus sp. J14TS2]
MVHHNQKSVLMYTKPVGGMTNIGDPFILKTDDMYYMYATSQPDVGFKVWQSPNLVDWEEKGLAYSIDEQSEKWATGDFWAPEVIHYDNQYYMTYSARTVEGSLQISIARSLHPLGPFIDIKTNLIEWAGSYIDGHLFIEEDGTPYFYYVKDCSENIINGKHISQIYVQQLSRSLTECSGDAKLILEPDNEWEGIDGHFQWNEGPFLLKHQGKYYLMYSAQCFASPNYAIGYAVAEHPMGPFYKADENPILAKDLAKGVSGPGHNSVTIGPDGKTLYIVYHIHTDVKKPSGNRQMCIDRLFFVDGKLKIDGPTVDQQQIQL